MGKRSNFERVERDFYPTPREAVEPLFDHLPRNTIFAEPCAGDGALTKHLGEADHFCSWESDIYPRADRIVKMDAFSIEEFHSATQYIITNPPWDRKILHPMIDHFRKLKRTWLLFDADWMHTKQSAPYMKYCSKIVSVGRVKWIPDSKHTGKDNCCWYRFENEETTTEFIGR